jgi:hypothetical protein
VRVLHALEIEVLFPVGTLFLERCGTIADLNPSDRLIFAQSGVLHVALIFAFRYRPVPKSPVFYGLEQVAVAAWFYTGSHKVPHKNLTQSHASGYTARASIFDIRVAGWGRPGARKKSSWISHSTFR